MNNHTTEKWKKVSAKKHTYRKDYYVSNYGRVVSKDKHSGEEYLLKPSLNNRNGYYYTDIIDHTGKKRGRLIQTLVAEHFDIPKSTEDAEFLSHKDGNRANNQVYNLEYITQDEVMEKSLVKYRKNNKYIRNNSKLSESQVKRIKLQLKRGNIRIAKIARMNGVSDTQIKRIQRGENWGHIKV